MLRLIRRRAPLGLATADAAGSPAMRPAVRWSLVAALGYVLICWWMYRRRIFIHV